MRIVRTLALLGLAAVLARPARASAGITSGEYKYFDNYCSTGSFQICTSVRVFSEGNKLRMRVWNMGGVLGGAHTMTAIGLYHSGSPWVGQVLSYSVSYDGGN